MKIRRFNFIILTILFIFLFFYYVLWQFISSPFFAGVATRLVNESIPAEYRDAIQFKKIRVGNFPPRIIVEEISLKLEDQFGFEQTLIEAEELQVGINVFSSYRDKFSLSHVKLYNGFVLIQPVQKKRIKKRTVIEKKKSERKKIKTEFNKFVMNNMKGFDLGKVIISRFELEKMYVKYAEDNSLFVQSSSVEAYRDKIYTELDVEDLQVNLADLKGLSSVRLKGILDKNSYEVEFLKLSKGSSLLNLRGEIKRPFDKLNRSFNMKFSGELVPNEISQGGIVKELGLQGVVKFQGESIGRRKVERISSVLVFKNFRSKFLIMDKGVGNVSFDGKSIYLNKLRFELGNGEVKLNKKAKMFNFDTDELLNDPILLSVKNIPLSQALVSVPPVSRMITGNIDGGISLLINSKKVSVVQKEKIKVRNLGVKNETREIFRIKQVEFDKSEYDFDSKKEILTINTEGTLSGKKIIIEGTLEENKIDIKTNSFYINLDDMAHLGDLEIEGYGKMKVDAVGSMEKPFLNLKLDLDKAMLAKFYMGRARSNLVMDLKAGTLDLKDVDGEIGTGKYSIKGKLDFPNQSVNVRSRFKDFNIESFRLSHGPAVTGIDKEYWGYVTGVLSGEYLFKGGFDLEALEVTGTYLSDDLTLFNERINSYRANMKFINMELQLTGVEFDIGNGAVKGEYNYNIPNEVSRYGFKSDNLNTKDLSYYLSHGLGYSSKIKLNMNGVKGRLSEKMKVEAVFYDSIMSGRPVKDSRLYFDKNEKNIQVSANFLENVMVLESKVDLTQKDKIQNGQISLDLDIPHWSYILNLISSYDLEDDYLKGGLVANLKGEFSFNNWQNLNLIGGIQNFSFDHPQIDVSSQGENIVEIKNGNIEKWNFKVIGSDNEEFISTGRGSLKSSYDIEFKSRFILDKINRVLGSLFNLKGNVAFNGGIRKAGIGAEETFDLKFKGNDVSVSRIGWYTSLDNTFFEFDLDPNRLKIQSFTSKLGNGDLEMSGTITNLGFEPEFNLKYGLNDAVLNINERSFLVVNGGGNLLGSSFPYALSGEMRITGGEVFDEFEKFTSDNSAFSLNKNNKYTPNARDDIGADLASLNINTTIEKEIWFRNSLVDFKILGAVNITGSNSQPLLFGKVFTNIDKENKIVIKNNDLFVDKLIINFAGNEDYTNPLVDFASNMKTNDYKVYVQAYGPAKNLSIDFSSDPYLNRQSILSLMAFGYAEQYSDRLSESDRDSISSAGVGSFLFNRLKINETLKDNLGITLNVGTEFQQDQQSFLQGRTQSGGRGNSVRSSTKVEVNKKITDNVDLSVSSSISGSIGQQQKVNLNYTINENVRLEGVYELRTDQDGEEGGQDKSVGADVKFRWTFK